MGNEYILKDSIIPRDIDGIYFAIDAEANYYSNGKGIDRLNTSAYQLLSLMKSMKKFNLDLLVDKYGELFINPPERNRLMDDVKEIFHYFMNKNYFEGSKNHSSYTSKVEKHNTNIGVSKEGVAQLVMDYWGKRRHIYSAGIELTTLCNFHCIHCYNQNEEHCAKLTTNEVKKILDILYDNGVLMVYFTGGEIMSRKDFAEIYVYAKKRGFLVELLTNGSLITDEIIKIFNKYPPANVSISIYGDNDQSYYDVTGDPLGYTKVVNNITKLHQNNINMLLKYIVLKENLHCYRGIKELAAEFKQDLKYGFELFPTLHGEANNLCHQISNEEILEIEKEDIKTAQLLYLSLHGKRVTPRDKYGFEPLYMCSISRYMILIDYQGYIQPCTIMRKKEFNILNCDLKEAWSTFEKYIHICAPENFVCRNCKDFKICNPCVEKNLLFSGDKAIPSPEHCDLIHMRATEFSSEKYNPKRGGKTDGIQ